MGGGLCSSCRNRIGTELYFGKLVLRNGLCHRSRLRDNYLRVCVCNVGRKGGSVSVTVLLCVSVSVWGGAGAMGRCSGQNWEVIFTSLRTQNDNICIGSYRQTPH